MIRISQRGQFEFGIGLFTLVLAHGGGENSGIYRRAKAILFEVGGYAYRQPLVGLPDCLQARCVIN